MMKQPSLSFMLDTPDWCFSLIKQCFCRIKVGDLDDITNCLSLSSAVNVPQLVGSLDGTVLVPMHNWSEFFDDILIKSALSKESCACTNSDF